MANKANTADIETKTKEENSFPSLNLSAPENTNPTAQKKSAKDIPKRLKNPRITNKP